MHVWKLMTRTGVWGLTDANFLIPVIIPNGGKIPREEVTQEPEKTSSAGISGIEENHPKICDPHTDCNA
jgi:hypothetical protein